MTLEGGDFGSFFLVVAELRSPSFGYRSVAYTDLDAEAYASTDPYAFGYVCAFDVPFDDVPLVIMSTDAYVSLVYRHTGDREWVEETNLEEMLKADPESNSYTGLGKYSSVVRASGRTPLFLITERSAEKKTVHFLVTCPFELQTEWMDNGDAVSFPPPPAPLSELRNDSALFVLHLKAEKGLSYLIETQCILTLRFHSLRHIGMDWLGIATFNTGGCYVSVLEHKENSTVRGLVEMSLPISTSRSILECSVNADYIFLIEAPRIYEPTIENMRMLYNTTEAELSDSEFTVYFSCAPILRIESPDSKTVGSVVRAKVYDALLDTGVYLVSLDLQTTASGKVELFSQSDPKGMSLNFDENNRSLSWVIQVDAPTREFIGIRNWSARELSFFLQIKLLSTVQSYVTFLSNLKELNETVNSVWSWFITSRTSLEIVHWIRSADKAQKQDMEAALEECQTLADTIHQEVQFSIGILVLQPLALFVLSSLTLEEPDLRRLGPFIAGFVTTFMALYVSGYQLAFLAILSIASVMALFLGHTVNKRRKEKQGRQHSS